MCAGAEGDFSPGPQPFPQPLCSTGGRPPGLQSHVSCEYGTQGGHRPGTLLCTTQALSRLCTSTGHSHSPARSGDQALLKNVVPPPRQLRGLGERGHDIGGLLHPAHKAPP